MKSTFSKKKFCGLSKEQQHKKCAHALQCQPPSFEEYYTYISWMGLELNLLTTDKMVADRFHFHAQAAGLTFKEHNLPFISKEDRLDAEPFLPIIIYLDGLRSLHNLGSIIRTTEAFRLGTIVISPSMTPMLEQTLNKSAMGTQKWVQCHTAESPLSLPKPLIAVDTIPQAIPYFSYTFPETFTIAFGNEERGLSAPILESADLFLQIPLYGRKNSLNVANAFAIIASAIIQQRRPPR